MRAFSYRSFGGPDTCHIVEGVPLPTPGAGQVRVKVHAASINPIDFKRRSGAMKMLQSETFPVIMGYDAAGTVDALGEGVTNAAVGDRVFLRTTVKSSGTLAEYCITGVDTMAPLPASVSFQDAAAVPLAGMTAQQMLRQGKFKTGDRVFVNAAAGGVGHFAIQLAKAGGASFVAGTASAAKHSFLRQLGADECVDYRSEDYTARYADRRFDVGCDNATESDKVLKVVKEGGAVVSATQGYTMEGLKSAGMDPGFIVRTYLWFSNRSLFGAAEKLKVSFSGFFLKPARADLEELAALLVRGALRPTVTAFDGLENAAKAMELLESGRATGKVVVNVIPLPSPLAPAA